MIRLVGTGGGGQLVLVRFDQMVVVMPHHHHHTTSSVGTADDDKVSLLLPFDDGWYGCGRMLVGTDVSISFVDTR